MLKALIAHVTASQPALPQYTIMSGRDFDEQQWSADGLANGYYQLQDDGGVLMFWAYVPDGIGGFYYPTLEEAFENHG